MLSLTNGVLEIAVVGDVVTVENRLGLVARYHHCDLTVDAGPDHVPDCRPAEVMEEGIRFLSSLASLLPGLAELLHRSAGFRHTAALLSKEDQW